MPDRNKAPEFNKPEIFKLPDVSACHLSNGVPYFGLTNGDQAAVKLELIFNGGHFNEPSNGLSFFTSKMLTAGTKSKSAAQIEETIASFGAFMEISSGYDQVSITVYCLDKFLRNTVVLLAELLTESIFPEEELRNLKNIQSQNIRVSKEKTSYLASVALRSRFFKNQHPYSRVIDEHVIDHMEREAIRAYYPSLFSLANCAILIAGGGEDSYTIVDEVLGALPLVPPSSGAWPNEAVSFNSGILHIEKDGALQSTIRLALPAVGLRDPQYPAYALLNEILGGYFGSRLMKNIREDKGYSYGIHSSIVNHLNAAYMVCGTDVNKDVRQNTIDEIYMEMERLRGEPVGALELETVKNYMLGSYLNSLNTPFAIMDKYKALYFHRLPSTYYEDFYASMNKVSSDDLQNLANHFLDKDAALLVSVG